MAEAVRRTVRVACGVDHAFDTFTARIDLWWPRNHRRYEQGTLAFEAWEGGALYETTPDGQRAQLGEVVRWDPPHRLVYTWFPGSPDRPTRVEITFHASGDATDVDVIHTEGETPLGGDWAPRAERFIRAWATVLPAFEQFVQTSPASGHEPRPRDPSRGDREDP